MTISWNERDQDWIKVIKKENLNFGFYDGGWRLKCWSSSVEPMDYSGEKVNGTLT